MSAEKEEFIRQKKEAKKEMNLSDRSIEGWYNIIVGNDKRKRGESKKCQPKAN